MLVTVLLIGSIVRDWFLKVGLRRSRVYLKIHLLVYSLIVAVFSFCWRIEFFYDCMLKLHMYYMVIGALMGSLECIYLTRVFYNANIMHWTILNCELPNEDRMTKFRFVRKIMIAVGILLIMFCFIITILFNYTDFLQKMTKKTIAGLAMTLSVLFTLAMLTLLQVLINHRHIKTNRLKLDTHNRAFIILNILYFASLLLRIGNYTA